jgi:hypothetical protein
MIERDPKIFKSGLSRTVEKDGVTVEVSIIRLEHETEWSLEVVNFASTSIVWDDLFASDDAARRRHGLQPISTSSRPAR